MILLAGGFALWRRYTHPHLRSLRQDTNVLFLVFDSVEFSGCTIFWGGGGISKGERLFCPLPVLFAVGGQNYLTQTFE